VQVDPIQAVQVEFHVPVEHIVDRDRIEPEPDVPPSRPPATSVSRIEACTRRHVNPPTPPAHLGGIRRKPVLESSR